MEYYEFEHTIVLKKGEYKGYKYVIISYGTHPCAYVCIPKKHKYYEKSIDELMEVCCHGGITYSNSDLIYNPLVLKDSWWIGWDYAHCYDYSGRYISDSNMNSIFKDNKKWTTKEIFKEVKEVINELK